MIFLELPDISLDIFLPVGSIFDDQEQCCIYYEEAFH